jgi:hypothetical protein
MSYKPYIPQNIGEILDQLAFMRLYSPSFKDKTGYFPKQNIDTVFFALNEGLLTVGKKLGEERYTALRTMSDQMRASFESDPDSVNGGTRAGCKLIREMEDILRSTAKPRASK